jgi:hypothetical protein
MDGRHGGRAGRPAASRAVERSEQFYGTLEERQLAVLRNAIAQSSFDPSPATPSASAVSATCCRRCARARPHRAPSVAQATALFRATLERTITSPDPAYRSLRRACHP